MESKVNINKIRAMCCLNKQNENESSVNQNFLKIKWYTFYITALAVIKLENEIYKQFLLVFF